MFKTSITKSKAGHYTVTIRKIFENGQRQVVFTQRLINNVFTAREVAAEFVKTAA